jgi:hypothetical protein
MKICRECEYSQEKAAQDRMGNIGSILLCMHPECRDVIDGAPAPCLPARQAPQYCGFEARYYKKKEEKVEDLKVVSLIQKA